MKRIKNIQTVGKQLDKTFVANVLNFNVNINN